MKIQRLNRPAVWAGAIVLALLGWRFSTAQAELGIPDPGAMSYEGTLRRDGVPVDGEVTIGVTLFDSALQTTMLCQTSQLVTVSDGRFAIELPDACTDAVEASDEAWIAVTADFGDGPEVFPIERVHAAPYAVRARNAHNGLPVGGVIAWWRPTAETPVPEGFEICDGSAVADPQSPLAGTTKPDLTGRFVRGVEGSTVGFTTGGSDSVTVTGGDHAHVWLRKSIQLGNVRRIHGWDAAGTELTLADYDSDGISRFGGAGVFPFGDQNGAVRDYYTQPGTGVHSHDIATVPSYVGLIYLVRVR